MFSILKYYLFQILYCKYLFTVTFNQCTMFLLNKSINFFQMKKKIIILLTQTFSTVVYTNNYS